MDVIHFPDDAAAGALGPAGAGPRQLRRRAPRASQDPRARAPRRRRARRRPPVVMTFDPHPPRVVRPDKAPPLLMTTAQKLEAHRRGRRAAARRSSASRRSCRAGIPKPSCGPCSSTGCTWPKCGSAPTFSSATIAPATSRCCGRSARSTGSRPRRSIRSATRTSSSAARASAAWSARGGSTRRARCSATSTSSTAASCEGDRRGRTHRISDGEPADRERAAAAARRVRDDGRPSTASCGRRSPTSACGRRSITSGRTVVETHVFDFDRDLYGRTVPRGLRAAAARRARVRVARRAAGRRSPTDCGRARVLFDRLSL